MASKEDYQTECSKCGGDGKVDGNTCYLCYGRGVVQFAYPGRQELSGKDFPEQPDTDVGNYRSGRLAQ